MPMARQRCLSSRGAIALLISAILTLLLAMPSAPAAAAGAKRGEGPSWAARQIRKGGIAARDRELAGRLPGRAKLGYHPETGRVRFISGTPGKPLAAGLPAVASGQRRLSSADARDRARRFIGRYGQLFGLASPDGELRVRATRRHVSPAPGLAAARPPNATVRFEQLRDGVPVMGGEIAVQLSAEGEVLSAAGEVLPSAAGATTRAAIGPRRARNVAAGWLAREAGRAASSVRTTSEGLAIYDPRVMDDPLLAPLGSRLVWRIDARLSDSRKGRADHRLVLVDARAGQVLTTISRIHTAEGPNRRICDNRSIPGRPLRCRPPYARSEGQPPTGVRDVDALYGLMGVTYDYFLATFGRDGVDGQGSSMKATVRYCPSGRCPWRNAEWKWGGQQAVFGAGWARADDIVAHEFTHGVIDAEAPLFYQYQSGAINEAFADVFGELVDLSHAGGKDTAWARWKIGEDAPPGAFRDMRDPTRFGHPDRVRSRNWHVKPSDDGGVHRNSGVGNKAAALMADGGTFRGYTIKPIGLDRTARVWYQALTTRVTPAANYIDLADALVAACTDLAGIGGMTLAHCASVRDATRATQMHLKPRWRAPKRAPVCPAGRSAIDVFYDDLENPASGAWAVGGKLGRKRGWYWPQNPNDAPGWDGTWASSGAVNFYAPNRGTRSDATMRLRQPVTLPAGAYLRFGHGYSFDKDSKRRYDGGLLEMQVDGGRWQGVAKLFTHGGYNGRIAAGYGNPLAGQRAWTGDSQGWSTARVDLSRFAGSQVRLRFRSASDRSTGARGWYVDDVRIYTCAADDDAPTGTLTIDGGAPSTSSPQVTLSFAVADPTTWVTTLRVSGSPELNRKGRLRKGLVLPFRETLPWDLADTTYGGSGGAGPRQVYAQVRDAAGNWSPVFAAQIELLSP